MLRTIKLSLAVAVVLILASGVATAGKPPKAAAPPIYYHIQFFTGPNGNDIASVYGMNNLGVMVGNYYINGGTSGWMYHPGATEAIDLNEYCDVPEGFTIAYATDVNDFGFVLAGIETTVQRDRTQPGFEAHGLLIDTWKTPWEAILLPDAPSASNAVVNNSTGWRINNRGDILGTFIDPADNGSPYSPARAYLYTVDLARNSNANDSPLVLPLALIARDKVAMNDPAPGLTLQIAGVAPDRSAFRYTVGSNQLRVLALEQNGAIAINNDGVFCGRARIPKKGNQFVSRPYLFDFDTQTSPTLIGSESAQAMEIAYGINDSGDLIMDHFLYHNSNIVAIDDTVSGPNGDFYRNSLRGATQVSERTANGFPIIGASMNKLSPDFTWGCLLVPQLTPQQ